MQSCPIKCLKGLSDFFFCLTCEAKVCPEIHEPSTYAFHNERTYHFLVRKMRSAHKYSSLPNGSKFYEWEYCSVIQNSGSG